MLHENTYLLMVSCVRWSIIQASDTECSDNDTEFNFNQNLQNQFLYNIKLISTIYVVKETMTCYGTTNNGSYTTTSYMS
jgi:hypothetical protein